MSDILRVTTPLVNKSQVIDTRRNIENIPQFNLTDISRVVKTTPDKDILKQNTGLLEEKTSALLLDLLKDPAVTVSYLKNIALLREAIGLLGANNRVLTEEIEAMFAELMLSPEELLGEIALQEQGATRFRGDLFEMLRDLLSDRAALLHEAIQDGAGDSAAQLIRYGTLQKSVVDVLKAMVAFASRREMLGAVGNNLTYLSDQLAPSKNLSALLASLAARFREPDAETRFETLKREAMVLFDEVEESILFSPKMDKVLSIAIYNLSRFTDSLDGLEAALDKLLGFIPDNSEREALLMGVMRFIEQADRPAQETSRVLDKLIGIIERQAAHEDAVAQRADQVEKIIQSLLSSPCNFTPLLHMILPLQYEHIQSFMELWINPNGEEDDPARAMGYNSNIHMLMVFDIGDLGRFTMELYFRDKVIDFSLFCPPMLTEYFAGAKNDIGRVVQQLGYRFGEVRITDLERDFSLMDIFKSLPYKRTGVDVKV